jgi:hypothetical protein
VWTIGQNLHPEFLSHFWKQQQDSLKRHSLLKNLLVSSFTQQACEIAEQSPQNAEGHMMMEVSLKSPAILNVEAVI